MGSTTQATKMSKINSALLESAVHDILTFAKGGEIKQGGEMVKGKVRKFTETVELRATLKNYDPKKMKRFNGTYQLPVAPKPNLKICVFANETHIQAAKAANIPYMSVDDLKKLNKDKKLVKKLAQKYDAFLASDTVIKLVPRLLGPTLNRAGKFPTRVASADDLEDAVDEI